MLVITDTPLPNLHYPPLPHFILSNLFFYNGIMLTNNPLNCNLFVKRDIFGLGWPTGMSKEDSQHEFAYIRAKTRAPGHSWCAALPAYGRGSTEEPRAGQPSKGAEHWEHLNDEFSIIRDPRGAFQ